MLKTKTTEFVNKSKELKKKIFGVMMSDVGIEAISPEALVLIQDAIAVIDLSLEVVKEQSETLTDVNSKLDTLLEKIES